MLICPQRFLFLRWDNVVLLCNLVVPPSELNCFILETNKIYLSAILFHICYLKIQMIHSNFDSNIKFERYEFLFACGSFLCSWSACAIHCFCLWWQIFLCVCWLFFWEKHQKGVSYLIQIKEKQFVGWQISLDGGLVTRSNARSKKIGKGCIPILLGHAW